MKRRSRGVRAGWRCSRREVALMTRVEGRGRGSDLCWGKSGTDALVINNTGQFSL